MITLARRWKYAKLSRKINSGRFQGKGKFAKIPFFRIAEILKTDMLVPWSEIVERAMAETAIVSSRGQITLPARLRKRLGIRGGDPVVLEEKAGEIVLKPALLVQVDYYSDEQVEEWDRADRLSDRERRQVVEAVTNRS